MGAFGGRAWQAAYSAVKVPLLLLATLGLSLPSFFVLNTLLGVRADFAAALRAIVASQAGADDRPGRAGPVDGVLVRLVGRLPGGDPVQRRDVRRRQPRPPRSC